TSDLQNPGVNLNVQCEDVTLNALKLRRLALSVEALSRKVMALENKYDASFRAVFDAIRDLMQPPTPPRKRIGFSSGKE
ncbi:MAG: hypothetical protein WCI20_09120, partial [bacterium]